jgi:hypothetical protein
MATDIGSLDRKWVSALSGLLIIALVVLFQSFSRPPQIGTDDEVRKTVDALFTAVTTKDLQRLDDCDNRLKACRTDGRLPGKAARQLNTIIQQARGGHWDPAAKRLYDFIYGQRGT